MTVTQKRMLAGSCEDGCLNVFVTWRKKKKHTSCLFITLVKKKKKHEITELLSFTPINEVTQTCDG